MTKSVADLASDYFGAMAERFPVMCASDEFPFLPRAGEACRHLDRLDDLSARALEEAIQLLKGFRKELSRLAAVEQDLETEGDVLLLQGNMAGALIELEKTRSWRHNPLLYLKTAFIGLDHALTKPAADAEEVAERAAARLGAVPRLLHQARSNLKTVPEAYHGAALLMLADCRHFLAEIGESGPKVLKKGLERARSALNEMEAFLSAHPPLPDHEFEGPNVAAALREHFGSLRNLAEVFEIAEAEWRDNLLALKKLQARIESGTPWRELYHRYLPRELDRLDTLSLYRLEAERLQRFFQEHGFPDAGKAPLPEIRETPTYLKNVRSSASFAAAITTDRRERDFFYVTTSRPAGDGEDAGELLRKRLHREYRFLSAHETFPGHLLLDHTRRNLKNRVRAQIESPLFYEGWAYYVESLLVECGYVEHPLDQLVDHKRRLWRAARCQIDVGLANGMLDPERALDLLTATGFSRMEAGNQVARFRLNPGYQLCYSLGRYELVRLRDVHGGRLTRDRFHREILQGGELPFHLIEKRLSSLHADDGLPGKD